MLSREDAHGHSSVLEAAAALNALREEHRRAEELRLSLARLGRAMLHALDDVDSVRAELEEAIRVSRDGSATPREIVDVAEGLASSQQARPPSSALILARQLAVRGTSRERARVVLEDTVGPAEAAPALDATYGWLAGV